MEAPERPTIDSSTMRRRYRRLVAQAQAELAGERSVDARDRGRWHSQGFEKSGSKPDAASQLAASAESAPISKPPLVARLAGVFSEILLAILCVIGPATWGVVNAWSSQIALALAAGMCACVLLNRISIKSRRETPWWLYLPVWMFVVWTALQLVPIRIDWLASISPVSASVWSWVGRGFAPLSVYPLATARSLSLLLITAAVLLTVIEFYGHRPRVLRLMTWLVVIGTFVIGLSLAQHVMGSRSIYWFYVPVHPYSGPFMNHNHFGQFVNLTIGAALMLILTRCVRDERSVLGTRLIVVNQKVLVLLIGYLLLATTAVVLSTSRGALLSLAGGAGVVVFLLGRRWGWTRSAFLVLMLAPIVALIAVLFGAEGSAQKMSRFLGSGDVGTERTTIWKGALDCVDQFALTGAGAGTFEYVFPIYGFTQYGHRVTHAENDYLQLMAESGIVGLALFSAFVALVSRSIWRGARRHRSASYAAAFALTAVALQSLTDFGQHLAANAVLSAIFCGMAFVTGWTGRGKNAAVHILMPRRAVRRHRFFGIVNALFLLGLLVTLCALTDRDRRAESAWFGVEQLRAGMVAQQWAASNEEYARLIDAAQRVVQCQPRDVTYRYWLAVFRWRSISRVTDEQGFVILPDRALKIASRIADDFETAASVAPSFADNWLMAGQIRLAVSDHNDSSALEAARRAAWLDKGNLLAQQLAAQTVSNKTDPAPTELIETRASR